eukprot:5616082-Amphidinium_carterae.3
MPYRSWCTPQKRCTQRTITTTIGLRLHQIQQTDTKEVASAHNLDWLRQGLKQQQVVMENGFGQTIIQVDNEQAILQLAQEAARELTIPGDILLHIHIKDKVLLRGFTRHSLHNAEL